MSFSVIRAHLATYRCGVNLNFSYNFGFLVGVAFILQLISGLALSTRFTAFGSLAFEAVQVINREVPCGWEFRYLHCTGASLVFACIFLHMLRSLVNASHVYLPTAWFTGVILMLITMVTAFLGYVLPWGQMSFWGATVICNILSPFPNVVPWLLGGFYVDDVTLQRFFVLHFAIPFVAVGVMILHIFYLHLHGSSNPLVIDCPLKVPFYPLMLLSDLKGFGYLMFVYWIQLTCGLLELGHPDNSIAVNRFQTPLHIVPEWYFLAYYGILKGIPSKTGGLVVVLSWFLVLALNGATRGVGYRLNIRQGTTVRNVVVPWVIILVYSLVILQTVGSAMPQTQFIKYGRTASLTLVLSTVFVFLW